MQTQDVSVIYQADDVDVGEELVIAEVSIESTYAEEDLDDEECIPSLNEIPTPPVMVLVEQGGDMDEPVVAKAKRKRKRKCQEIKFMDKNAVLPLLLESESDVTDVPDEEVKVNHYFLLKDDKNFYKGRRRNGRKYFNVDNYQSWENVSLKKHHYLYLNGEYKYIDYIAGKYQLHTASLSPGKKGSRQPLPEQPSPDEVLVMRKMYGTIRGKIKRRISYIEKCPADVTAKQESLILVEYCKDNSDYRSPDIKSIKLEKGSDSDISVVKKSSSDSGSENEIFSALGDQNDVLKFDTVLEEVTEQYVKMGGENKGIFFDRDDAIEILLNSQTTLEEIPQGVKENEYFIVSNEDNHQRTREGKRRSYVDDCGVWKNVSMKKQLYGFLDNKYIYVDDVNGKYKIANNQLRARYPEGIKKSQILITRKVYGSLKREDDYRRRITWIDEFPEVVVPKQKNIALVEYIGKYPNFVVPHGNQKRAGGAPYVRTSAKLMKEMKEKVAYKTANQALKDYAEVKDASPRGLKQLQNLRYRSKFKVAPCSSKDEAHNDELRKLLLMVHENNFVQETIFTKYHSPLIIAYTPQQMNSWRHRCQDKSGLNRLLGVDRTLNVGTVCLTVLTYPHPNLLCRKTSKQAVMMGPAFLHVDKSWQTYTRLFTHIKGCLGTSEKIDVDGISIACKTEEEEPLTKALKFCFPSSTITLCAEHMKIDLRSYLSSEVCVPDNMVENITEEIFSELLSCSEEYDFDMKLMHLQSDYDANFPQFSVYFSKLAENIKHSLWRPTREERPLMRWSNETCEALDCIITSSKDWVGLELSELILEMQKIVNIQEQDEIKALHNEGNFVLASYAIKYQTDKATWKAKTNKQRARLVENLRKVRPGSSRNVTRTVNNRGNWNEDMVYY